MVVTMRLYRMHDLDLLYLYKMPDISIQKIIRNVLKAYVLDRNSIHGISHRVSIPRKPFAFKTPKSALIHIRLDEEKDKAVIEWIEQIPKGIRNALLKNILRSYLEFPITIPYETDVENSVQQKELIESVTPTNNIQPKEKKTKQPKQKEKTDIATEVLNTPLYSEEKKEVKQEELPTATEVLETKDITVKQETNNGDESEDTTNDVFDDFESLMKDF